MSQNSGSGEQNTPDINNVDNEPQPTNNVPNAEEPPNQDSPSSIPRSALIGSIVAAVSVVLLVIGAILIAKKHRSKSQGKYFVCKSHD